MSIISAGTSNTTSLVYTGDTTGNLAFQINGTTEAMRITSGGNVGIGTASPSVPLQVKANNSSGVAVRIQGRSSDGYGSLGFYNNAVTTLQGQVDVNNTGMYFGTTIATPIQFYTNDTERMRIDSSGRVTQPFQPSFHVRVNNAAYISTSPVPFSNAVFNVGSNFNTSTYRFTAPVAGKYNFLLQMYLRVNTNQYVTFYLRVNDTRRLYSEFNQPSQQMYTGLTLPAIFDLSVGDFVDVEVVTNGSTYYGGNQETNFFGYLLG
jgi:hypothetical protein